MVSFTALRVKIRQPVYFCQTNALQGRIIWYDAPRFPRRKQASTKHYPVVGFPSGQREQTVNLPSSTSKVRILPPPPSPHVMPSLINLRYFIFYPTGKDEKLRLRFDSSASERTLPQATARRARNDSDELSFPLYSRALCNHLYCYLLARASLSEATGGAVW